MSVARFVLRAIAAVATLSTVVFTAQSWKQPHGDLENTAGVNDAFLRKATIGNLDQVWSKVSGDVSATPSVVDLNGKRHVFYPDWFGNLFAKNAEDGSTIWTRSVSSYALLADPTYVVNPLMVAANAVNGPTSRNTPTYLDGKLYFGDQVSGRFYCVNAATGNLVWSRVLDTHPAAMITQSPAAYCKGQGSSRKCRVIIGVSSAEVAFPLIFQTGYTFTFRGSVYALDADNGAVVWRRFMIEDDAYAAGFTGAAVWGSAAAIDLERNTAYVTTGQNYQMSNATAACIFTRRAAGQETGSCVQLSRNRIDAVVALNLDTGAVIWSTSPTAEADTFNAACLLGPTNPNCIDVSVKGPDGDFPQGVIMYDSCLIGDFFCTPVVAGQQKSGNFWVLRRTNGVVFDHKVVGTTSENGATWGSCLSPNGETLVTVAPNADSRNFTLIDGQKTTLGVWSGYDVDSKRIIWQIPDPLFGHSNAMVTCTQQIVFVPANGPSGNYLYALNIRTGATLNRFPLPGKSVAGPAIVDGFVFQGYGYGRYAPKTPVSGGMVAFAVPAAC